MKTLLAFTLLAAVTTAHGQTMYRCQPVPGGPVAFQQTPCAGSGETVAMKSLPLSGAEVMSASAHRYLDRRQQARAEQAEAAEAERQRREALGVERDKARAAEAQAAAQRATARAILAAGWRYRY